MDEPGLMVSRSWRWLRTRIVALLDVPPTVDPAGRIVHATRIGLALDPPKEVRGGA